MPMPKNIASPMAMIGSMVSNDAIPKPSGTSRRIAASNGPTAAIDGRRLSATSTILTINPIFRTAELRTCIPSPLLSMIRIRPGECSYDKSKSGCCYLKNQFSNGAGSFRHFAEGICSSLLGRAARARARARARVQARQLHRRRATMSNRDTGIAHRTAGPSSAW